MSRRRLLFTLVLGAGGLGAHSASIRAQELPPPPGTSQAPPQSAQQVPVEPAQIPAPPTEATASQTAPAQADQQGQPEVLNRGPIHEAFAVPGSDEPIKPGVIAKQPPEPIDEVPPDARPDGENVIWIPGYWAFDVETNDFLWVTGVWRDVPPGHTWVPGYWTQTDGGFIYVAGNWVDAEVEQIAYLPEPPASQESGPSSPAPDDGYFWVPGSWVYDNSDYRWHAGYWAPHQRDWIWVPARYTYSPFGYVYTAGYWDYLVAYRGVAFAPVYFRTPGPYTFTPVVALDSWQYLMMHLFVGPRFGNYYFGDYYGPTYANLGYVAFFDFHQHNHRFDPLYNYYSWRFGRDFNNRLVGWHNFFRDHDDFRPRRTFREQRDFAARHRDDDFAATTMLSSRLDDIVRSDRLPMKFSSVTREQRDRLVDRTRRLRDFSKERVDAARDFKPGRERPNFRVRGNDRLSMPDNREGRRPNLPELPDRMKDIKPDDREGKSARMPSPRSNDRDRFTPDRTLPRFPKSAPPGPRGAERERPNVNRPDAGQKDRPEQRRVLPQETRKIPAPSQPKANPSPNVPRKNPPATQGPPAGTGRKSDGGGANRPAPKIDRGSGGGGGGDRSGAREGAGRKRT